jgi:DNA-damage-inducible protein D
VEFWLARDLQHLPGYTEWRNFTVAISKAKTACEMPNHPISDHFVDVNKMVDLGSGSQREVSEVDRRIATEEKKSLKNSDLLDS